MNKTVKLNLNTINLSEYRQTVTKKMGLDMYLTKKTYVGAEYKHRNVKGEVNITIDGKPVKIDFNRITFIEENIGYWRKVNHIHQWFVDNVQDGEDDCKDYSVSKEHIETLLDLCKKVKENPTPENCSELLPTQSGFFFGGTDYDKDYIADINYTIQLLENILKNEDYKEGIYYTSSW